MLPGENAAQPVTLLDFLGSGFFILKLNSEEKVYPILLFWFKFSLPKSINLLKNKIKFTIRSKYITKNQYMQ